MKNKLIILFILSYAILSCNQAENIEIESHSQDSITFSINTNIKVSQRVSAIKTTAISVNETLYEDFNMYIFDEKGNLFDHSYTTKSSELNNIKLTI